MHRARHLQVAISRLWWHGERADLFQEAEGGNLFLCAYEAEVMPD
jgi:hypothetical protein